MTQRPRSSPRSNPSEMMKSHVEGPHECGQRGAAAACGTRRREQGEGLGKAGHCPSSPFIFKSERKRHLIRTTHCPSRGGLGTIPVSIPGTLAQDFVLEALSVESCNIITKGALL